MLKRKIFVMFVITVITMIFIFFASCAKEKDPSNIRVVLDWTPNTNHTGLYAALQKGFFSDEGLTVTITQPPEDGALLLVGSGLAEFGIDFQETMGPAIASMRAAIPVTAVAAIINHNTSGIMSLRELGITSAGHLQGRRFASWQTPLVTELVKTLVENDGGNFSQVRMIPNFATDAISALQSDIDIDAIWVYYAWDGIAAVVNNIDVNFIDIGKSDSRFDFYTPVIFANNEWLSKNGDTAKKFLSALSRGYYFAIENPIEAAEILLQNAPELDRKLVLESQQFLSPLYKGDAKRWGEIDGERWSVFYKWMYENNLLETDIGFGGFTNEYLP